MSILALNEKLCLCKILYCNTEDNKMIEKKIKCQIVTIAPFVNAEGKSSHFLK